MKKRTQELRQARKEQRLTAKEQHKKQHGGRCLKCGEIAHNQNYRAKWDRKDHL